MIEQTEDQMDKVGDGMSSVSSDNDSRANIARFTQSWRHDIVGTEFAVLHSLQMRYSHHSSLYTLHSTLYTLYSTLYEMSRGGRAIPQKLFQFAIMEGARTT